MDINFQENDMNKDQIKGKIKEVSGVFKEATGKILQNKELEENGIKEEALGRAQVEIGNLKEKLKK